MVAPLAGIRVVELGQRVSVPYLGKLFVDAGAEVLKVESPAGDRFRSWSSSGADLGGADSAWFRFLNGGKRSRVIDLEAADGVDELAAVVADGHLILDDHQPARAAALGIDAPSLRRLAPQAVVATITPFGTSGPWANRPANDLTLQALTGGIDGRGIPGEEPVHCGGDLGDFVVAAHAAPAILASTLASVASGEGTHLDCSAYEAAMTAFQVYRPMYEVFAPDIRSSRQIEVPSIEPAKDGLVGFCTITGQQWLDFLAMVGAEDLGEDESLFNMEARSERREELWARIRSFTTTRTVDELLELAEAFRIPVGPIGTGDVVDGLDHFRARGVFVDNPHGFRQPRPPYRFSASDLVDPQLAPSLGADGGDDGWSPASSAPSLPGGQAGPLSGVKVLDLSAFWAGPVATNVLRALGADLIKVESHVRLDGMRWASGLQRPLMWEWSPVYHNANVGKRVINLDLSTERGRQILLQLVEQADVVIENYSPRVTEQWGVTWERIQALNPATSFVRVPAFGIEGPWRDRVGFAMTMEQVSGLANRTGHPDGPRIVPRGPVDSIAGMHAAFASVLAVVERERTGAGQLVELPLIEGALQAAAEQVVEFSAYGAVLERMGNRSAFAAPQGLFETNVDDVWLAVSVETDEQWRALQDVVPGLDGASRGDGEDVHETLSSWAGERLATTAAAELWQAGVPAAPCVHFNDTGKTEQLSHRRFFQWREHPVTGWTNYSSFCVQVDGQHLDLGAAAPMLGQHNEEILAELGLSADEIQQLWDDGITGDWPAMVPR